MEKDMIFWKLGESVDGFNWLRMQTGGGSFEHGTES
jgi:hypothetical protein